MSSLFEISSDYEEILTQLYDDEDKINEEALMKLENNTLAMEKKAIAIASYIKNLEAEREAIKLAKDQMSKREERNKKREEDLLGYLLTNMQRRGITKISCAYFDIKLKKCPCSINIIDEKLIPEEYTRTKTQIFPDKIKMLQEMKVGVLIPGADLQQNVKLEIK